MNITLHKFMCYTTMLTRVLLLNYIYSFSWNYVSFLRNGEIKSLNKGSLSLPPPHNWRPNTEQLWNYDKVKTNSLRSNRLGALCPHRKLSLNSFHRNKLVTNRLSYSTQPSGNFYISLLLFNKYKKSSPGVSEEMCTEIFRNVQHTQ